MTRHFIHFLRTDYVAAACLLIIVLVMFCALTAPVLYLHDPNVSIGARNLPPAWDGALLGTDGDGRDILSRLIWGARFSLITGIVPTFAAMVVAIVIGLVSANIGGITDEILMRCLDVLFAFPIVLVAIIVSGILSPGLVTIMIAIFIAEIPYLTKLCRTTAGVIIRQPYIEAARASGARTLPLLVRYAMPNMLPTVLSYTTAIVGMMIVLGAGLNFLGLGIQPPQADWGSMVAEGRTVLRRAPHVTLFPGFAIVMIAVAFSMVGDGLRRLLDPRGAGR
ncbi:MULTISPECIES: ABC transporter permease [unclassified Rhizobium]|uniref:ABC transporter permease n=1 Tax=unclassified Rhizobium TaxID=2613769 RepID=UPI002479E573|nr:MULTISPECIES: ABC transporter permease [unclassified Rhizobium]MDH7804558.1 peptide/nickel transport system permease protein [Rhizobium sp. AN70]